MSDIEKAYDFHAFCHEVVTNEIALTELDRLKSENVALKEDLTKCPCKIADKPCCLNCTCIHAASSSGCLCCASYGSEEQRKERANLIVNELAKANADQVDPKKAIACAQWFSTWGDRFDEMDFPETAIDEAKQILQGVFKVPARQDADQWIPVSVRLPEPQRHYLCETIKGIIVARYTGSLWISRPGTYSVNVLKWRELPTPTKV